MCHQPSSAYTHSGFREAKDLLRPGPSAVLAFLILLVRASRQSVHCFVPAFLNVSPALWHPPRTQLADGKWRGRSASLFPRSDVGPRQLSVWNTAHQCHDIPRKYIFSEEGGQNPPGLGTPQDIPLPPRRRELPASLTTNGKADPRQGARTSVMQELVELEKQIQVIRQELQLAVSRKAELEEYQRARRTPEF